MKKTFLRKITVVGKEYKWIVSFNNDGDGGTFLRIFDQEKNKIYDEQFPHADLPVTPRKVKDIIIKLNDAKNSNTTHSR